MRHVFLALLFALLTGLAVPIQAREYRILAIRVDFPYENPDHDTTSGRGAFDLGDYYADPLVHDRYYFPWDIPPHDRRYFINHLQALDNYWRTVSEDSVTVRSTVWPENPRGAYRMANTFYKYGNGRTKEQTYRKLAELFREAVETCKRQEGGAIDFADYDTFMIIHAGIGQETSGGLNDIPSAYLNGEDFRKYLGGPLTIDGVTIDNGIIVPEMTADNGLAGLNGILAQMFGHRLGLPSLSNNRDGLPAAGGWTLMDTGGMAYGHSTRGFVPTIPDIWSKIRLGLIEPVVVTSDTTLNLAATHRNIGIPRAIKIPITADEYLLLENRERYAPRDSLPKVTFSDTDSSGVWMDVDHYDAYIPGSGVLIWHINDRIIRDNAADDAINNDPYRRGVDLLEADGRQDIGAPFGFGDPRSEYSEGYDGDTYKKTGNGVLSPSSEPHSGSMWGGNSGITVKVNSEPGDVMNVSISFASKTARIPGDSYTGALTAADLDGDGVEEILVSRADSLIISDAGRGRVLSLPADSHPVVIPATDAGRNVFAIAHGNRMQFYSLRDFLLDLLAETLIPERNGTSPTLTGAPLFTHSASGGHLIVPVHYSESGQADASALLNFSLKDFPSVNVTSIALSDTARIVRIAAAGDFIAAAGENGVLYTVGLDSGIVSSLALPGGAPAGMVIADLERDAAYDVAAAVGRSLYFVKMKTAGGVSPSSTEADILLPDEPVGEPVVADIDRDGFPEVLQCTATGLYAFRKGGVRVAGFPLGLPPGDSGERIVSAPIVCDFDGDGVPDIAFATSDMRLIVVDSSGRRVPRFPLTLPGIVTASPLVFSTSGAGAASLALVTAEGELFTRELANPLPLNRRIWPMWRGNAALTSALPDSAISNPPVTTAAFSAFCYPNPISGGSGTFRITPDAPTDCRVTVFSADGVKVFESYLPTGGVIPGVANEIRMDASQFASGLYLARIKTRTHSETIKVGVLK